LRVIELPESQRIARDVLLRKFYLRLKKEKGTKIADGKEAAQGDILHAEQKGKLPV
jgi:hypothetical protein